MTEFVVPFEHKSTNSLLQSLNLADALEPKPDRRKTDGMEFLVGRFKSLKIEIFANEHPPPHFHVKTSDGTAIFRLDTCEAINGDKTVLKLHRTIKKWYSDNRGALIETWNKTRPGDCPVGVFRE